MLYKLQREDLKINKENLIDKLRISEDDMEEFLEFYNNCLDIACPKYLYEKKEITSIDESCVMIEKIPIKSIIATQKMTHTGYAYPYVVTCGKEIYDYTHGISDPFVSYWADTIMEQLLYLAIKKMNQDMKNEFKLEKTASVNPGSTVDWHISGQKELFSMFSDKIEETGIFLTSTFLMLPIKSASGIVFSTEEDYTNCQDCERKHCPNRRKENVKSI